MANDLQLRLNPALDVEAFAAIYRRDRLVQIHDVFEPEIAAALREVLLRHTPWRLVHGAESRPTYLTGEQIKAMGQPAFGAIMQRVMQRAAENHGYLYNVYPMIKAYMEGWDPGHPLHQLTEFLQSEELREFGRRVIGAERITKVDAQATCYGRGHFLTRHIDDGDLLERRAAYTLGFSPGWQPDWGGLLAFLTPELNVESGWTPGYNVLTLFDGLRIHSVTAVAPFAPEARYSITGWLRDDPPAGVKQ